MLALIPCANSPAISLRYRYSGWRVNGSDYFDSRTAPAAKSQKYTYKDGRIDTLEVMTRPDPDAPKSAGPAQRKDFYNPLQSQIQLGGRGR